MATFAISTLLKAGLITFTTLATGASIATPIILSGGGNGSSVPSEEDGHASSPTTSPRTDSVERDSSISNSDTEDLRDHDTGLSSTSSGSSDSSQQLLSLEPSIVSLKADYGGSDSLVNDESSRNLENRGTSLSPVSSDSPKSADSLSPVPAIMQETFDKTCFVIPVTSDNGLKLLACLGEASENDANETYAEYTSLYYLNISGKENLSLGSEDKLIWSPNKKEIFLQLKERTLERKGINNSIFKANGEEWNNILDMEVDLKGECLIFKNDSVDSSVKKSHLFVCGNDLEDFSDQEPRGIPLSSWKYNQMNR